MSQFLEILETLCREKIPSQYLKLYYTSIATLRSLVTKESFQESINSFLKSPNAIGDSKQTAIAPNVNNSVQVANYTPYNTFKNTAGPSVSQVICCA